MRTAYEIFEDEFSDGELAKLSDTAKRFICDAINQARKETIEACAESAKIQWLNVGATRVNKQSILSLKNDLK